MSCLIINAIVESNVPVDVAVTDALVFAQNNFCKVGLTYKDCYIVVDGRDVATAVIKKLTNMINSYTPAIYFGELK